MIRGKRHDLGLGPFPVVTLAEARDAAFENRRTVRAGGDPLAARRKAATRTFEANRARWRSAKQAATWMQRMERHAFPKPGDLPVDRVEPGDVLRVLTPIWTKHPETARKVRGYIRTTLAWSQSHRYVEGNAAGEVIDAALPAMPKVKAHLRALPYGEVAAALATIDESGAGAGGEGLPSVHRPYGGAQRRGAGRDVGRDRMERRTWTVPWERMKAGAEHRVPLSDAALAVLRAVRPLSGGSGLVLPSPTKRGRPLSDMTLTKILRTAGLADRATVHGFRSSFRDWCADTGKKRDVAEAALAHVVGGVEGAYFRSDVFERRRELMAQWAAYVTRTPGAKVVPLHA